MAGGILLAVICARAVTAAESTSVSDTPPSLEAVNALIAAGAMLRADAMLQQLETERPDDFLIRFTRSAWLSESGRDADAVALLKNLLLDVPSHPAVHNNLAWILASSTDPALRDPEAALAMARDALLIEPRNPHIWSTVAQAHYGMGDFRQAATMIDHAMELAIQIKRPPEAIRSLREQQIKLRRAASIMSLIE
jgi:predicted Zn-dependent protease